MAGRIAISGLDGETEAEMALPNPVCQRVLLGVILGHELPSRHEPDGTLDNGAEVG